MGCGMKKCGSLFTILFQSVLEERAGIWISINTLQAEKCKEQKHNWKVTGSGFQKGGLSSPEWQGEVYGNGI